MRGKAGCSRLPLSLCVLVPGVDEAVIIAPTAGNLRCYAGSYTRRFLEEAAKKSYSDALYATPSLCSRTIACVRANRAVV